MSHLAPVVVYIFYLVELVAKIIQSKHGDRIWFATTFASIENTVLDLFGTL